jgi:hypothetical protein
MKKLPLALSALALALTLGAAGSAQATLLADLIGGQSITAGDKVFDQWSLLFQDTSDRHTVNTSNIDVTALSDGGMNPGPGLSFSIMNNEFSVTGDGTYAYTDFTFGFHVSTLGTLKIKDNSLTLTNVGLINNTDDLGAFILETVGTSASASDLGMENVEFSELVPVGSTSKLTDSASFAPQDDIYVTKNILVWATDPTETASLTGFSQRFSQIPEPGTLLLFIPAMAALVGVRRRKATTA